MIPQSEAKIFPVAERGHYEQEGFRSYSTFNSGEYQKAHKAAFGPLYLFNDNTLAGGRSCTLSIEEDTDIIVLPTVGTVACKDCTGRDLFVEAGEALLCSVPKGTAVEISNPYEQELINFLQIGIKRSRVGSDLSVQPCSFDLETNKNQLLPLFSSLQQTQQDKAFRLGFIGKFSGREEAVYKVAKPGNGLFVFVLEGAFEVQYRLLESGDGLALWNLTEIELEALSNDAIILLLEVPL